MLNVKILYNGLNYRTVTSTTKSVSFSLKSLISSINDSRVLNSVIC